LLLNGFKNAVFSQAPFAATTNVLNEKKMNIHQQTFRSLVLILAILASRAALSQNTVTAGELILEPPTLISLGFEWIIEGDDNRNARVALSYREVGERRWREGLPLLRVHNERTVFGDTLDYTAPNMFAGSLFYLQSDKDD